jgi:hypothetical protein
MDVLPLYRRTGFVAFLGLIITSGLYYWALRASFDSYVPRSLLTDGILILGLISVTILFLFIANLLFWIGEPQKTIAAFIRLFILGAWIPFNAYLLLGFGSPITRTVLTHLDLGMLVLLLMISLTAQFVLPVRESRDRLAVIRRLLGFLVGERGPVTFIHNGEARESYGERMRRAPGVFLIDHASAAVLRTNIQFTRPAGPGVTFSNRGEWRAESLDLRRQIRSTKGFTPPSGEPAKLDKINSLAITRDGIPVSTDLSVTFMLDPGHSSEPREGRDAKLPPYEFNKSAAEKAVYGHAYSEFEDLPWTELPLRLVIDLWRELVKEQTLLELIGREKTDVLPLLELKVQIKNRLISPTVETREQDGRRRLEANREYDVLQSRGIRVLDVGGMTSLYLPDEIHKERMLRWREAWAGGVQEALAEAKEDVKQVRHRGEAEAYLTLVRELTTSLRQQIGKGNVLNIRDTLKSIVDDAIRISSQPGLVADRANLVIQLNEMMDELSTLDENCQESDTRGEG